MFTQFKSHKFENAVKLFLKTAAELDEEMKQLDLDSLLFVKDYNEKYESLDVLVGFEIRLSSLLIKGITLEKINAEIPNDKSDKGPEITKALTYLRGLQRDCLEVAKKLDNVELSDKNMKIGE